MYRHISLAFLLLLVAPGAASSAPPGPWSWPLEGRDVAELFAPPADPYGPGHRGVDLPGSVGEPVHAVAAGRVTFAGQVGGVAVITVDHGGERSTYQPVRAQVRVGDAVQARQVIGTLLGAHSHCLGVCLHLGRRVVDDYLDPLDLLKTARFQLISPDGPPPRPPAATTGDLIRPVGGPVTSAFGLRVHPITGIRKLHDGTDFGVACGTPVRAAAAGRVTEAGFAGAYGGRVAIRHSDELVTTYNHLSSSSVSVGEHIEAGQIIAVSGSTGMSTGCHLHFMVVVAGTPTDPMAHL